MFRTLDKFGKQADSLISEVAIGEIDPDRISLRLTGGILLIFGILIQIMITYSILFEIASSFWVYYTLEYE